MKNIGIIVTVGLTILGVVFGYGKLIATAGETRKKIEKIEVKYEKKIDKNSDKIHAIEKYDIQQSALIESSLKILDKLEKKLEKK